MHPEQMSFCKEVKERFPEHFKNVRYADIGSLDINGNNRHLFEDSEQVGIDLGEGKNVDVVCRFHEYDAPENSFDVILSTEAFEHDSFLDKTLNHVVKLLKPGGLFFFTCAGPDRWEHGTSRTSPPDSPFTLDYYRNVSKEMVEGILDMSMFSEYEFRYVCGKRDLQFWGILK